MDKSKSTDFVLMNKVFKTTGIIYNLRDHAPKLSINLDNFIDFSHNFGNEKVNIEMINGSKTRTIVKSITDIRTGTIFLRDFDLLKLGCDLTLRKFDDIDVVISPNK